MRSTSKMMDCNPGFCIMDRQQLDNFDDEFDHGSVSDEPDEGSELYEHFRFVADKGQTLLRVTSFLCRVLKIVAQQSAAGCRGGVCAVTARQSSQTTV